MFKIFIQRPVLATVISILLVILGLLGLTKLPLQQFPDIAPPAVSGCGSIIRVPMQKRYYVP